MLFSSHFLLGLGALINIATAAPSRRALVARLEGVADDDCNAAWLGDSVADGKAWDKTDNNNVDPYFCSTRWKQGAVVVGIKIWNDKVRINGIQLDFSDGTVSNVFGRQSVDETAHNSMTWSVDERITEMRMWRATGGGAVGRIKIVVGGTKLLEIGPEMKKGNSGTSLNIHSGMLIAVRGRSNSGKDLRTAEFRFFPADPQTVQVVDLKMPADMANWSGKRDGMDPVTIANTYFPNPNEKDEQSYRFGETTTKKKEHKVDVGSDAAFGTKVTTKAVGEIKIPWVATVKGETTGEINFGYTWKKMDSEGWSDEYNLAWMLQGKIPVGMAANCTAMTMSGTYATKMTAVIETVLADGTKVRYDQEGQYKDVAYSAAFASCKNIPLKEVPKTPSGLTTIGDANKSLAKLPAKKTT